MKWILMIAAFGLPWTNAQATNQCLQAVKLLQKIRAEQREGYSIQRGNELTCQSRFAKKLIKQRCKRKAAESTSQKSVSAQAKRQCKGQK